ncbi:hypothetical protein PIB30_050021 [Stylosanthes scabra]|uniref:Uncharacterized protein n=1 Tax=Stylosanthes scabra TaxID=79078 RepID=A0ABU6VGM5_9FABA|nr:hypothetical protein [Stylosanthes scabra]
MGEQSITSAGPPAELDGPTTLASTVYISVKHSMDMHIAVNLENLELKLIRRENVEKTAASGTLPALQTKTKFHPNHDPSLRSDTE